MYKMSNDSFQKYLRCPTAFALLRGWSTLASLLVMTFSTLYLVAQLRIIPLRGRTVLEEILAQAHVQKGRSRVAALLLLTTSVLSLHLFLLCETVLDHFDRRLLPLALESLDLG
uniref:(northern house mosquito) hypothetical protein n=1 Tax=Culex pipiens TaxID=7175 RepID=A0A8D8N7Y8_CULPI